MKIDAVLFDYGSTLVVADIFDVERGITAMLDSVRFPSGASREEVERFALELEDELFQAQDMSFLQHPFRSVIAIILDTFRLESRYPIETLERIYYDAAMQNKPAPHVELALESIGARGLPMGVVSNSSTAGSLIASSLQRLGLMRHLRFVISSADYGIKKQHRSLFTIALARIGAAANRTLYVGDALVYDVKSAASAGLSTCWYHARERDDLPVGEAITPDFEIHDWSEFETAVFV